ncbi:hypothetical protein [Zavarzinia aquatilis]|uniref:Uncharacterized protein n=1 Tax=Zavarzinia aquatilis TaxID=2211142 RepID=A0A317EB71_9PROT|nr:hypothetical protein [Zavarzinia aquatilis]PWR24357.1 hypothetical protein DKG74_09625 [Zavarzinia aquatilis]
MVGRLLGWIFVALALMCLGADTMAMLERGEFGLLGLGALWAALDANSMIAVGDAVAGYTFPELWNPGITTLLRVPGLLLFGLIGVLLLILFRKRERPARLFTS